MMLFPMEVFASPRWSSTETLPAKIKGWVENVHSRPQYKKVGLVGIDRNCLFIYLTVISQALEKGGPYELA